MRKQEGPTITISTVKIAVLSAIISGVVIIASGLGIMFFNELYSSVFDHSLFESNEPTTLFVFLYSLLSLSLATFASLLWRKYIQHPLESTNRKTNDK